LVELESSKRQAVVALIVAGSLWLIALESWFAAGSSWAGAELGKERIHVTYYILYSQKSRLINKDFY
jgi:hypothetical protein